MSTTVVEAKSNLPVIPVGYWVRLGRGKRVPESMRGRVGRVAHTVVERRPGGDDFSLRPYDYQSPKAKFDVVVVELGEKVNIPGLLREDFDQVSLIRSGFGEP